MLLSHLLEDPDYYRFYRDESKNGSYLILDNSAHEFTKGGPIERLMSQAELVGASEVVLPDVLFESVKTLESTSLALRWLCINGDAHPMSYKPKRFMVVPQGKTPDEFRQCLEGLIHLWGRMQESGGDYFKSIDLTIGVSKDYEVFEGGMVGIVNELLCPLSYLLPELEFHLLGWGRDLWAVKKIAKQFDWIRSTDSAKPFVYGHSEVKLDCGAMYPTYPSRPTHYFTTTFTQAQRMAAEWNVNTFTEVTRGQKNGDARETS